MNQTIINFEDFKNIIKTEDFFELINSHNISQDARFKKLEIKRPNLIPVLYDTAGDHRVNMNINLDLVLGVCNPKFYPSNMDGAFSWSDLFNDVRLERLRINIAKLRKNPDFYYDANTNPDIELATFDGGNSYYIVNGNHRVFIAKFLFALEQIYTGCSKNTLYGVIVNNIERVIESKKSV